MSKIPIPQGPESTPGKKEFDPISDGFHAAVLIDLEHHITPNSQKAYVRAEFEIDEDGAFKGRHVSTNLFLTPDARWRLDSFLFALGHEVPATFIDPDQLVGRRCKIRVKYSDENPYPDVTKFRVIRAIASCVSAFEEDRPVADPLAPVPELDDDKEEDLPRSVK